MIDTDEQTDTLSMLDGLVQGKPLWEKHAEQGLIPSPRAPVET